MRTLALVTMSVLAGCSGGGDQEGGNKAASTSATTHLTPGLWEMTSEVSGIAMAYKDVEAPDTAKMSNSFRTCITEEQAKQPSADAFAGKTDGNCKYDNFYMSRGRINASMICQPGNTAMNIDGTYTADTIETTMELSTYQGTADDMKMTAKLSGRRISDSCPVEEEAEPKAG